MTMKIAHILPSLAYAGPILISQSIVNGVINSVDVDVFYFDDIVETNFKANAKKIKFFQKIDFEKYDIIHTHMLRPDLYIFLWKLLGYCKSVIKISTVHQFIDHDQHNQYNFFKASAVSSVWHRALSAFDTIVAINQLMLEDYKLKYPKKNVVHIDNGIEDSDVVEEIPVSDIKLIEKIKKNKVCLGAAARINKNKGFEQIIKLLSKNKHLCFVLIGDGPNLNNLKKMAEKNDTLEQIIFMGKINNAKRYFKHFDIFVMPSEKEGFGLTLLEAASMSIPAVCSENKVFETIFTSDEVSFFELNNVESLDNAVQRIIKNKALYSVNINKRFKKSYTSNIMANNYLRLYETLIKKE